MGFADNVAAAGAVQSRDMLYALLVEQKERIAFYASSPAGSNRSLSLGHQPGREEEQARLESLRLVEPAAYRNRGVLTASMRHERLHLPRCQQAQPYFLAVETWPDITPRCC